MWYFKATEKRFTKTYFQRDKDEDINVKAIWMSEICFCLKKKKKKGGVVQVRDQLLYKLNLDVDK